MLFFVVCACFALFPGQVLAGAQNGLALCINAVIPSLLPFMLISTCVIKSGFSRPLGRLLSKILTPLTGITPSGCVCFITGLLGGYGTGARAVYESLKEKQISYNEAERLLAFCNNAGPLFVIGTVGISFFSSKSVGITLFLIQVVTSVICARILSGNFKGESQSIGREWEFYKKNKPSLGELITSSAIESGSAIVNACVFVITFSAILEILPFGEYTFLAGILEVTRGSAELSREGTRALPLISALLSWGGVSVHFQAAALCKGEINTKIYYIGKVTAAVIAYILTKLICADVYVFLFYSVLCIGLMVIWGVFRLLFSPKGTQPRGFRQRRHS